MTPRPSLLELRMHAFNALFHLGQRERQMFKAENGSVYAFWDGHGGKQWVQWAVRRCLLMARQYRRSARDHSDYETIYWQPTARKWRRELLTALVEARAQRQPVQFRKAA